MSQDNIGYFIQLDPSVNFDISKDGKIFTHHAGKGKYKGLRLEKEGGNRYIFTYSNDGTLLKFIKGRC